MVTKICYDKNLTKNLLFPFIDPWIGTILYKKYEIISKIGLSLLGEMYRVKDKYAGDE